MAIKKSELYSSLWKSCDELRGSMDASQYKDYVLVLLFVKYISDRAASRKNYLLTVPKGGSFADMVAAKGDKEIGEKLNKIVGRLADANDTLRGAISVADFNDEDMLGKGQAMVDRLTKLVAIFEGLEFGRNSAEGDDLLGDAYEYLMRHFATESGKSKGQFYTPAEVSRVMAKILDLGQAKNRATPTIYDPTCGSGSLLLKVHDEAQELTGRDFSLYGQENDSATSALARMNMVLHDCPTAEIELGNTLADPHFLHGRRLKAFDYVVANPPFSFKSWSNGVNTANDRFHRFEYGVPPAKNGDYAFLLHILASLNSAGKGAVILPHGVLFRGGAEGEIRRRLVRQGFIKGLIGLPANLFYGTGIPACIVVLDKENAPARRGIFMIDASRGFIKDGNKNRLRAQDIHKIVDIFTRQLDTPKYARMVPFAEIETHGFSLNLPRYIDGSEPEDLQDIEGHLKGGIPVRDVDNLAAYWKILPGLRAELFAPADRANYCVTRVPAGEVKQTIFAHAEFVAFNAQISALFAQWKKANHTKLTGLKRGDRPKALIHELSESLLDAFRAAPLLDAYDVYQHLMDYWVEAMQDDCYLVSGEGWDVGSQVRELFQTKNRDNKLVWLEQHDFKIGKRRFRSDIIPRDILVARYFASECTTVASLENELSEIEKDLDERLEEQGVESGPLEEVVEGEGDKRKITAKSVKTRIKEIGKDKDFADEHKALIAYSALLEKQSDAKSRLKQAQGDLDKKLSAKYLKLTKAEIEVLVVDDKWLARLAADVQSELDRVSQVLTARIRQLAERYETPLPKLVADVDVLETRVGEHFRKMGFAWS